MPARKSESNGDAKDQPSQPAAPRSQANNSPSRDHQDSGPNKPLGFELQNLDATHAYLTVRGLTPETIAEFGLGFCAKGSMDGRVVIPIHNADGKLLAYAGRWPGQPSEDTPKYKLPHGFRKSLELYNIDRAVKEPADTPLVIVEGFFGCMSLHQHGHRKVVALMGSSMSQAQEETIRRHTNRHSRVILMLDEDEAGQAGREDIAVRLAKFMFVKVHTFGEENRQPESLTADELAMIVA